MPNYDWRDYRGRSWTQRFPEWSKGFARWSAQANTEGANLGLIQAIRRLIDLGDRPSRPCVFVSHRQADVEPAARIAYLACQEGFDYWLDVFDPALAAAPAVAPNLTPQQAAATIAAVIEVGLLNSTHVVAVMTPNTKGSQWVPYEYGRVREPVPSTPAAAWVASSLPAVALPEYLYLGVITKTELELKSWLQSEFGKYGAPPRPCGWNKPVPAPL
jgi:hypothetical protein